MNRMLKHSTEPLPSFDDPPVNEVVLDLHFRPIPDLAITDLGLFRSKIIQDFPVLEFRPPVATHEEQIEVPPAPSDVKLKLSNFESFPRCWFRNEGKNELLQIQRDRFIFNWIKTEDSPDYPRYGHVEARFFQLWSAFQAFLADNGKEEPQPKQCEVVYVNTIHPPQNTQGHDFGRQIIAPLGGGYTDAYLPTPENVRYYESHLIGDEGDAPIGRLHVAFTPKMHSETGAAVYELRMTARCLVGRNRKNDFRPIFRLEREAIVRGFTALTTKEMHRIWGRNDG